MAIGNIQSQAWFPADAVVKLEKKGSGSQTTVTTTITSFSYGGGEKNTDSIAHFGNAFLLVKKPQAEFTVDLDIDVTDTTWMEVLNGSAGASVTGSFKLVTSGGAQNPYKVKLEWTSKENNEAYKIIYYNAYGVTFTKTMAADDRLTGTFSFNSTPTDTNGSPQLIELETRDRTSSGVGSAATGSYGFYEKQYDTTHGYSPGSML